MANVILNPQSGTSESSKSISFSITGIDVDSFRLRVENTTSKVSAIVKNYIQSGSKCSGDVDIRIGNNPLESSFSIFFIIEIPSNDGKWKIHDIYPSIFNLVEKKVAFDGILNITPLFVGPSETCSIYVKSDKYDKVVFSINNRKINVNINNGDGSAHFYAREVFLSNLKKNVSKYPVYYYTPEDNYVNKKFSGIYITSLPQNISTHANMDPRCDPLDPAYISSGDWSQPTECPDNGGGGGGDPDTDGPDVGEPTKPPIAIPSSCKQDSNIVETSSVCRIHNHSIALLNNGQVAHAYTYVDSGLTDPTNKYYNKNRVVVSINNSSLDVQAIAIQDVSIAPKSIGSQFHFYVDESLFNLLSVIEDVSQSDISVTVYDKAIGYNKIQLVGRAIDEYTGSYVVLGEMENDNLEIKGWIFCVPAVFYYDSRSHAIQKNSQWVVPDVMDSDGNILQVINLSVASNMYYVGEKEEIYLYIIAEAFVNNQSQLFFYTHSVYKNGNEYINQISGNRFDNMWKQITDDGNNKNPKCCMDKTNTLHVFWESDRSEGKQIYYGVLGSNMNSIGCFASASILDKYIEFGDSEDKTFSYLTSDMIENSHASPQYSTSSLVDSHWNLSGREPLSVIEIPVESHYLHDLYIKSHDYSSLSQESMAFSKLPIFSRLDNPSADESTYLQFNFQVSFDFSATISQSSSLMESWDGRALSDFDIDAVYEGWKETFQITNEVDISGKPVYIKNGERFTLGRQDNIYDRIIPFFGSYGYDDSLENPSISFQVKILKNSTNLKDFVFGLLLEKSYFKAISLDNGEEENHKVYTGNSKFVALIKTEDSSDRSNYFIVREFLEKVDITQSVRLDFLVGYTKINSDEVLDAIEKYRGEYSNRYAGNIIFFVNGSPKFSHGFISTLSYVYNYFDLGFGIPAGGYYMSDKMLLSKLTTFDDVQIELGFSNVNISSPTYSYNSDIVSIPDTLRDWSKLKVLDESYIDDPSNATAEDTSFNLYNLGFRGKEKILFEDTLYSNINMWDEQYKVIDLDRVSFYFYPSLSSSELSRLVISVVGGNVLYDSGYVSKEDWDLSDVGVIDISVTDYDSISVRVFCDDMDYPAYCYIYFKRVYNQNTFLQIPITFEGINQSANVDYGICNDVHVVWESNRDRYWNIYTSNSSEKLRPYRFNTKITNTKSNSLMPDIAVSSNGKRLIVWHDDRDGKYGVYAARSVEDYGCDDDVCKNKMVDPVVDYISECVLSESYSAVADGTYHFKFDLYKDDSLTEIHATISSSDSSDGWYIGGSALNENGVYLSDGQSVIVSYTPSNRDDVFDRVLYIKLTAIGV